MAEYRYLIHLLRCAIHGDIPEELPQGMSFQTVYDYAMAHDVANLAFYAVEKLQNPPPSSLYDTWAMRRDLALVRDMHQCFARQELVDAFTSAGISFKELQGTTLKNFYPAPEYRTMSDLDFIVDRTHLIKCHHILKNLGYHVTQIGDIEIDGVRKPDVAVEIHTEFFPRDSQYFGLMELAFTDPLHRAKDGNTELYLYNIFHTAKHYFASGCGIRRVLDMYYLDLFCGDKIDRSAVDKVLEKAGLTSFARDLSALGRQWFGDGESGSETAAMEQFVFDAGLHGKRENYISSKLSRNSNEERFTLTAKVKYLLCRLFPGDYIMTRHYPVLRRVRILYPVCWIHRIVCMLLGKNRDVSIRDLKLVLQTKEDCRPITSKKE